MDVARKFNEDHPVSRLRLAMKQMHEASREIFGLPEEVNHVFDEGRSQHAAFLLGEAYGIIHRLCYDLEKQSEGRTD